MEKPGSVAPTSQSTFVSASGAALLDPPEAKIARPEAVAQSESTGMVLRSRSQETRSKV